VESVNIISSVVVTQLIFDETNTLDGIWRTNDQAVLFLLTIQTNVAKTNATYSKVQTYHSKCLDVVWTYIDRVGVEVINTCNDYHDTRNRNEKYLLITNTPILHTECYNK
jgi:hypothetical protein